MKKYIIIFSIAAYILVAFVLWNRIEDTALSYAAYLLSAIALGADLYILIPSLARAVKSVVIKTKIGNRFLNDFEFHEKILLCFSFIINGMYTLMNLTGGIFHRSAWEISFGVYYLILCLIRISLFISVRAGRYGENQSAEYKKYFRSGVALLVADIPLAGIITLMITDNYSYSYSPMFIYAMAGYVFYSLISCAVNIIKYRKYKSPVLSAAKYVNFVHAMISLLGLETALISMFGQGYGEEQFRTDMILRTGIVIMAVILVISVIMIINGRKGIKRTEE